MTTITHSSNFFHNHSIRKSLLLACSVLAISWATACSKSSGDGSGDGAGGLSDSDLALGNQQRFGEGNIPGAESGGLLEDVHFSFNSSEIDPQYQEVLRKNASILSADSTLKAEVEGHCDKRGTGEYNMALGEERAKAVARMLVNLGVKPDQLSTISYGEEIPIDSRDSEDAYAVNRRAHFALSRRGNQS